jgi:hypothetical protein
MRIRNGFRIELVASGLILLLCSAVVGQDAESKPHRSVTGLPRYMTDTRQPIPVQIKLLGAPKTARNVRCFRSFTDNSAMTDVVMKCGIPDEHQGSGIYIFLYDMNDGSVVAVGTSDLKKLLYVTHIESARSTSLLRKHPSSEGRSK